jgi:hypothetical protein
VGFKPTPGRWPGDGGSQPGPVCDPVGPCSAQAEKSQDEQDDYDGADEPDDVVHDSTPLPALKNTKRHRLPGCQLASLCQRFPLPSEPLCADEQCDGGS